MRHSFFLGLLLPTSLLVGAVWWLSPQLSDGSRDFSRGFERAVDLGADNLKSLARKSSAVFPGREHKSALVEPVKTSSDNWTIGNLELPKDLKGTVESAMKDRAALLEGNGDPSSLSGSSIGAGASTASQIRGSVRLLKEGPNGPVELWSDPAGGTNYGYFTTTKVLVEAAQEVEASRGADNSEPVWIVGHGSELELQPDPSARKARR